MLSDEQIHFAKYGYNDVNPYYYISDEDRHLAQASYREALKDVKEKIHGLEFHYNPDTALEKAKGFAIAMIEVNKIIQSLLQREMPK